MPDINIVNTGRPEAGILSEDKLLFITNKTLVEEELGAYRLFLHKTLRYK
jgi:hypothetical protein